MTSEQLKKENNKIKDATVIHRDNIIVVTKGGEED